MYHKIKEAAKYGKMNKTIVGKGQAANKSHNVRQRYRGVECGTERKIACGSVRVTRVRERESERERV